MADEPLRETALTSRHRELGARLVPFAGWSMPVQYTSTLEEHAAVRERCGIFDVGHMGVVFVRGADACAFLQGTLTNDLSKVPVGKAQYTLLCNDAGGVIDDLIVSRLAEDEWLVVPNASNVDRVVAELRRLAPPRVEVDDVSNGWGIVAIQGPGHAAVLEATLPGVTVGRFAVTRFSVPAGDGIASGTGYTGSPGLEVLGPAPVVQAVWDSAVAAGATPCGLGARDTLRLEMGYPLHGQEISPSITPLEAGLGWVVKLGKGEFPGSAALLRQQEEGVGRRSVGLVAAGRRPLRQHNPVLDADGTVVGEVTSGGYSPGLGRGIALALVEADSVPANVDIRGSLTPVEVVRPPFVDVPG